MPPQKCYVCVRLNNDDLVQHGGIVRMLDSCLVYRITVKLRMHHPYKAQDTK